MQEKPVERIVNQEEEHKVICAKDLNNLVQQEKKIDRIVEENQDKIDFCIPAQHLESSKSKDVEEEKFAESKRSSQNERDGGFIGCSNEAPLRFKFGSVEKGQFKVDKQQDNDLANEKIISSNDEYGVRSIYSEPDPIKKGDLSCRINVPIERSDPCPDNKEKVFKSVSHGQLVRSKQEVAELFSGSIRADSKSISEGSDESSSIFNSENDKPISRPSSGSSNHDSPDCSVCAEQIKRNLRVQSAMQDEGPALWQMQNQPSRKPVQDEEYLPQQRSNSYHFTFVKDPNQLRLRLIEIERKDAANHSSEVQ